MRTGRFAPGAALIIAEVAQNHDGSLGQAHAFIDAVARTGADAIKFQTHIADAESTPGEPFRVPFSYEDRTRYDYWKRMEFTREQWAGLKSHAAERGLLFLSTPSSLEAAELLDSLGVAAWKIGSGEVRSFALLERVARTKRPVYVSVGMSPYAEIDELVERLRSWSADFTLMQCTTAYPCPPEKIGLNLIDELRQRYQCDVGLSDHSGTIYPALASVPLGVSAIEVHVTFSREMFGPDVAASITTDELRQLVEGVRFIEKALGSPVNKDALAAELSDLRRMFGKSAVAARDLPAGTIVAREDIAFKKPGTGIQEADAGQLIGRKTRKPLAKNEVLSRDVLDA